MSNAAATDAFSDSAFPGIGIVRRVSQQATASAVSPLASFPITIADFPSKLSSKHVCPPLGCAA